MLYLEGTTERCSVKYVFFKTQEARHIGYEHITMTYDNGFPINSEIS